MQTALHSLAAPRHRALVRLLEQALRNVVQQLRRWRAAAHQRRHPHETRISLHALSDHVLRDLGLHRSEIESIAQFPSDPDRARVMRSIFGSHV